MQIQAPLPKAKMELFVTIVCGSTPCIKYSHKESILNVSSDPRHAFDYNGIC